MRKAAIALTGAVAAGLALLSTPQPAKADVGFSIGFGWGYPGWDVGWGYPGWGWGLGWGYPHYSYACGYPRGGLWDYPYPGNRYACGYPGYASWGYPYAGYGWGYAPHRAYSVVYAQHKPVRRVAQVVRQPRKVVTTRRVAAAIVRHSD